MMISIKINKQLFITNKLNLNTVKSEFMVIA